MLRDGGEKCSEYGRVSSNARKQFRRARPARYTRSRQSHACIGERTAAALPSLARARGFYSQDQPTRTSREASPTHGSRTIAGARCQLVNGGRGDLEGRTRARQSLAGLCMPTIQVYSSPTRQCLHALILHQPSAGLGPSTMRGVCVAHCCADVAGKLPLLDRQGHSCTDSLRYVHLQPQQLVAYCIPTLAELPAAQACLLLLPCHLLPPPPDRSAAHAPACDRCTAKRQAD